MSNRPDFGHFLPPGYIREKMSKALLLVDSLTSREEEVFALLGTGITNRSIGIKLGIAEKTVKAHVGRVLLKLGVESRTQAALVAFILHADPQPSATDVAPRPRSHRRMAFDEEESPLAAPPFLSTDTR